MTARRLVTLTCDKDGCRERYVGREGQDARQVRAEARKLAGWRATPSFGPDGHSDACRWHA